MEILVTFVSVNRRGREQRDQRRMAGALFYIGRGSQSQIHLPDARVALNHARVAVTEAGSMIEALDGHIEVNARKVDRAVLAPGDVIEVGPYELSVEPPPENASLSLAVRLTVDEATQVSALRRAGLRAPRLSKRRLSYLAFFGVLALTLIVPLARDLWSDHAASRPASSRTMLREVVPDVGDRFLQAWNPGPLSRSHQIAAAQCRGCHEYPFVQVRDSGCVACHTTAKEHVPLANMTGVRPSGLQRLVRRIRDVLPEERPRAVHDSSFRTVLERFRRVLTDDSHWAARGTPFREMRCAECHRDHKGTQLAPRAQELCVACHADIGAVAQKAESKDVTDFRVDHPAFRLTLLDAGHFPCDPDYQRNRPDLRPPLLDQDPPCVSFRVRQSNPPSPQMIEHSNLKYDHKVHLDPAGVRHPDKGRVVMKCSDCHVPINGGRQMSTPTMARHCQECHSLAFEPKVTDRQVPHGSVDAVVNTVREFYARLALGDAPPKATAPADFPRVRPGAILDYQDRQRVLAIADQRARLVLRELFETPRKVCSECHFISRDDPGAGWKVAPVRIATIWMPKARFDHAAHLTENCTSCHDVARSTDARDIAIPKIDKCRQCHVGAEPVANKVTSDCATCHEFHMGRDLWHKDLQLQMQARGHP